jgi:hypothetical protein
LIYVGATTGQGAPAYVVNKYPNAANTDKDNIKVIRLAEVFLIAAECANRLSDDVTAQSYLNALMSQRDPGFSYSDVGAALLSDIVTERRKELAFEGDRFYDLQRLGQTINRYKDAGAVAAGAGISIPFPFDARVAPIPQQEILRNPTIATQQNPGY